MEKDKTKLIRMLKWIKRIILLLIVLFSVSLILIFFLTAKRIEQQNDELASQQKSTITVNGKVLGVDESSTGGFKSDNYNVPQISFGGLGTVYYPMNEEQTQLAVNDAKSEIFSDKNKKYKKLLVSWVTPKPARCVFSYSKAGSPNEQLYNEDNYGYDHSVLVTPLDASSTYNYLISARDKWGNEIKSEKFAIYTGPQEISFLDLLAGAFRDVFGWAMR